jgi:hypothetical protein
MFPYPRPELLPTTFSNDLFLLPRLNTMCGSHLNAGSHYDIIELVRT